MKALLFGLVQQIQKDGMGVVRYFPSSDNFSALSCIFSESHLSSASLSCYGFLTSSPRFSFAGDVSSNSLPDLMSEDEDEDEDNVDEDDVDEDDEDDPEGQEQENRRDQMNAL